MFERTAGKLLLLTESLSFSSTRLRNEKKKPEQTVLVTVGIKCSVVLLTAPHTLDRNPSLENK